MGEHFAHRYIFQTCYHSHHMATSGEEYEIFVSHGLREITEDI